MDAPVPGGSVEDSEYYFPAATVVRFDPPLPLLRAPVPSPASGDPPVLAFRDAATWRAAWEAAEASLFSPCELAELPCASHARQLVHSLGVQSLHHTNDYQERERCEEREMASCLEAAKEACIKFSKEKCTAPFRDARIASEGLLENTNFIVWSAVNNKSAAAASFYVVNYQYSLFNHDPGATNYKGSDLLDSLASKDNSNSG